MPDLAFSLIEVTAGIGIVSIYYNSIAGRNAIETFFFNGNGKLYRALATYA